MKNYPSRPAQFQDALEKSAEKHKELRDSAEETEAFIAEGEDHNHQVKAKVNGVWQVIELTISPELFTAQDSSKIETAIKEAISNALNAMKEKQHNHIEQVLGGAHGLPGLF